MKDVEFYGQTVPAGSVIAVLLASGGTRDERHDENPNVFDITRNATNMSRSASVRTTAWARQLCHRGPHRDGQGLERIRTGQCSIYNAVFEVSPPLRSWE